MREKEKGKTMFSFTWIYFCYTIKEWAYKVVKINGLLKAQSTLLKGKCHPKCKCPCCENLWGNKLKLNRHFLVTPCPSVKVIVDCKSWPLVVKALQITNMFGVTNS